VMTCSTMSSALINIITFKRDLIIFSAWFATAIIWTSCIDACCIFGTYGTACAFVYILVALILKSWKSFFVFSTFVQVVISVIESVWKWQKMNRSKNVKNWTRLKMWEIELTKKGQKLIPKNTKMSEYFLRPKCLVNSRKFMLCQWAFQISKIRKFSPTCWYIGIIGLFWHFWTWKNEFRLFIFRF